MSRRAAGAAGAVAAGAAGAAGAVAAGAAGAAGAVAAGGAPSIESPEGGSSMESAKEEAGNLALEDAPPEAGIVAVISQEMVPRGPPTTYGPHRREESRKKDGKGVGGHPAPLVNPFWSQTMKDEAMLRAMRPSSLPQGSAPSMSEAATEDPIGMDLKDVMKAVMAQNSMLKRELADLKKKVEDSNKEKDRGFKEVDRPRPPSSTPPPSPPSGPPPATPEEEKRTGTAALGAIPEFPGRGYGGLHEPVHRPSGDFHQAGRGPPPVPESWLGALQAGGHGGRDHEKEEFETPHHGTPGGLGPGRGGLPDCAVKNGVLGKGSPLEQAAQSVLRQLGTGASDGGWGEAIRSVELPPLPELREGELGSLVLGDWIQLISPTMRDLSATSWKWWEEVLQLAMTAYREWLRAEPVQRLHIKTKVPRECDTVWSRLEQRGQLMLLNAVPTSIRSETLANRASSSVDVLYALFRRYQPGGLAERSRLLRQLVEPKSPQGLNETVELLRGWRRSLRRAQELEIATPDSTLLLGALDRMSEQIVKASSQAAFRTSSTRAALGVDVTPTLESVLNFADMLTAEAESLAISELQPPQETRPTPATTKVKAMSTTSEEKQEKSQVKAKVETAREEKVCRFWGTEEGCRRGQDCKFKHDWTGLEKKGRCFGCSAQGHSKKDCPVMKPKGASPEKTTVKAVKEKNLPVPVKVENVEPTAKTGGSEAGDPSATNEGDRGAGTAGEVKDLLNEATTLLKSLRPSTSVKTIRLSSLEVREGGRALLDGGATHCLRRAVSEEEWSRAQEVNVELAAGTAVLRMLPWTKTLLTKEEVQVIVPLGVLISLGYEVVWEKTRFELTDPAGITLDTKIENSCPTISEDLAMELIQEIERSMVKERARLAFLAGESGGPEVTAEEAKHLEELQSLFPQVPHHLLERLLPKRGWTGEGLPWNRHERRRVRKAKEVVIHLFSGDSKQFWQKELEAESRVVLCVDTVINPAMNLLKDDVFAYLLDIADSGTLCTLLGGPPCRTMSRLRYRQPGPPPLREREGPYRFGLPQLDRHLQKQVEDDTILYLRQLYLYHRAATARKSQVTLSVLEQPEDPEEYIREEEKKLQRYASYWSWPEWKSFRERWNMMEVCFDQGPMGHQRRKPTRLGTNVPKLWELQDIRGPGTGGGVALAEDLTERIKQSRTWSAWAPGLKAALAAGIRDALQRPEGLVRRMDLVAWKKHLLNSHIPYSRECKSCVVAASRGRAHKRIPHPDSYTLSIDTAGPFQEADDQLGRGRYLLIGVYLVPVSKDGQTLIPINEDDELPGAIEDGPEITTVAEESMEEAGSSWPGDGDDEAWLERVEKETDFTVKQITMTEILENRGGQAVVEAISRFHARLRFLGLPVLRLHSDRAGEYQSRAFDRWCRERNVMRTFTDADNFRGNGRAECAVAQVKRGARTLLLAAGLDESYWCHAARHWSECKMRRQLESMGLKRRELTPFGQQVWAKRKLYSDRQKYLSTTRTQVRILCPAVTMSLTTPGYFVQELKTGKFFHTGDIVEVAEVPEDLDVPAREAGYLHEVEERESLPQPRKRPGRVRGAAKNLKVPEEEFWAADWGELQQRGAQLLSEELSLVEEDEGEITNERFLKALTLEVEAVTEETYQVGQWEEAQKAVEIEKEIEEHPAFLQTRMVGLAEVRKNMAEWRPSMVEEYGALVTESEAVEPIDRARMEELRKQAAESGKDFDLVPAKAIFSRKAGTGRHKCRGVACGNFMHAKSSESTFASGASGIEVRMLMKVAAVRGWNLSTIDVKTAFLNAPVNEAAGSQRGTVVVEPPRIFKEAEVLRHPTEYWLVKKALYGLVTSPRDWIVHRDEKIKTFKWEIEDTQYMMEGTAQDDVWAIKSRSNSGVEGDGGWQLAGLCATYVDDILVTGERKVIEQFHQRVREHWKIGEPEWVEEGREPVRFLGMEIERRGRDYVIHQRACLENLFVEYDEKGRSSLGNIKTPEEEDPPLAVDVTRAQKETGELLWVAGRTRPDICLAVSLMCQWATKRPKGVIAIGAQVRAYLRETRDEGLVIKGGDGKKEVAEEVLGDVEVYSDASYASSDLKSLTGVVVCYGGTPIAWHTTRQAFITLSTAEAELMAMLEGLVTLRSTGALVEAVLERKVTMKMHSDSTAAIAIAAGTTSSWRTRHLRIRAAGLTEALRSREVSLRHVAGVELVADGMTKQLTGQPLKNFKETLG